MENDDLHNQKAWVFGPCVKQSHYHVPIKNLQLNQMIKRVQTGGCALVQGGFRSGKTSHMRALESEISSTYFPIVVTCGETTASLDNELSFWMWMSEQIKYSVPAVPLIQSADGFRMFMTGNYFGLKKVVLLIDEFQVMVAVPYHRSLLSMIKQIMDDPSSKFHCLLGFGTYSTAKLTYDKRNTHLLSPIPLENTICIKPLPSPDVINLFHDWASQRQITIQDDVCHLILSQTGCYAGLVGFVGVMMDGIPEYKLPINTELSVPLWLKECGAYLSNQLLATQQFHRVIYNIKSSNILLNFIRQEIIPQSGPYRVTDNNREIVLSLSDYGLFYIYLNQSGDWFFSLSAPMLYEILLAECYPSHLNSLFCEEYFHDISQILTYVVKNLYPPNLQEVNCWNRTTSFPSEYTIQAEIFATLKQIKSDKFWTVLVEAKSISSNRCSDILIQNGNRIVIEVKVCQNYGERLLLEHVEQVASFGKLLCCKQIILLHVDKMFTNQRYCPVPNLQVIQSSNSQMVTFVQVALSPDFTSYFWF